MYFPKSQIKSNQYSNGELYVKTTKQPYIGYYWSVSNGQCFAGRTPNSVQNNIELVKFKNETSLSPSLEPAYNENGPRIIWSDNVIDYLKLNKDIDSSRLPRVPNYNAPQPTNEDYKNKEINRYFCKKNNESLFIEVSKTTYEKLIREDDTLDYQSYFPFSIPWLISGEQNNVAIVNKNTIDYAESKQQAQGLAKYIKNNYLQFYGLYTDGGEYLLPNGKNYVGLYHIHPNKGPMVGRIHVPYPHSRLFPIDEVVTTNETSTPNESVFDIPLQISNIYNENNTGGNGY